MMVSTSVLFGHKEGTWWEGCTVSQTRRASARYASNCMFAFYRRWPRNAGNSPDPRHRTQNLWPLGYLVCEVAATKYHLHLLNKSQ